MFHYAAVTPVKAEGRGAGLRSDTAELYMYFSFSPLCDIRVGAQSQLCVCHVSWWGGGRQERFAHANCLTGAAATHRMFNEKTFHSSYEL